MNFKPAYNVYWPAERGHGKGLSLNVYHFWISKVLQNINKTLSLGKLDLLKHTDYKTGLAFPSLISESNSFYWIIVISLENFLQPFPVP